LPALARGIIQTDSPPLMKITRNRYGGLMPGRREDPRLAR